MSIEAVGAVIVIIVVVLAVSILLIRRSPRKAHCAGCHRAHVPGMSSCPFCGRDYASGATHTRFEGGPSPPPGSAPLLVCAQGALRGQNFPLNSSEFTIGRSASNALHLEGGLVSRHHAMIVSKDGQHLLYDRESTNGTYVNGQRIAQHVLQAGDQVQIGPFIFVFQLAGAAVSPQPIIQPPAHIATPAPVSSRAIRFEDYDLQDLIGGGGMATVYKGVSYRDGSAVAVKVFHQTDPYLREKFGQEIRIGQSLSHPPHPHIVQVYGGGESRGLYYMIMEFADNRSLRERLYAGHPMPLEHIIPIVGQTCDALSYAHQLRIYHRDIKPENILFTSGQGVKLCDFGIAKLATAVTHTMDGMIIGTPFYMSHEQAKGIRVDSRSDLYSLGVVLYEMLTGQPPFSGEPLTVIHKHITEKPVRPKRFNSSIPSHIEDVVMHALVKQADKRFQSAEEMARALGYNTPFYTPVTREPAQYQEPMEALEPRQESRSAPAQLVIMHSGQVLPLTGPVKVIQRREINSADKLISREHARIIQHGGQFWLEDLNSRNGTHWNELRIFEAAPLQSGDVIRVGHTQLRFERRAM